MDIDCSREGWSLPARLNLGMGSGDVDVIRELLLYSLTYDSMPSCACILDRKKEPMFAAWKTRPNDIGNALLISKSQVVLSSGCLD